MKKKLDQRLLLALLLVCAVFLPIIAHAMSQTFVMLGSGTVEVSLEELERLERYSELNLMVDIIDSAYYKEPDVPAMIDSATHAMLYAMNDPATRYHSEADVATLAQAALAPADLGLRLGWERGNYLPRVSYVVPDSPAQQAGIRAGDYIADIGGTYYTAYELDLAQAVLRGEEGEEKSLSVYRNEEGLSYDEAYRELTLACAPTQAAPDLFYTVVKGDVGCVVILNIGEDTAASLQEALSALKAEGATSLLLDLREATGGNEAQLMEVAALLLPGGTVTTRVSGEDEEALTLSQGASWVPEKVLIGPATGDMAEVLAAALKARGSVLYGRTTRGSSGQTTFYPQGEEGAGVYITTDTYLDPQGNPLYQVGVEPNHLLEKQNVTWLAAGLKVTSDAQLMQALGLEALPDVTPEPVEEVQADDQ